MPSYFISGANRGIGLALVERLLQEPDNTIVAGARNPNAANVLQDLKAKHPERLLLVPFDLVDPAKIELAAEQASAFLPNGLDYLINNAGVNNIPISPFAEVDLELLEEEIRVNAIAPIHVVRTFLPLVRKGHEKKVVFVSSNLGSMEEAGDYRELSNAYSMGKAALNMMARKWGTSLKPEGISTIVLHPGWVGTDMGQAIAGWVAKNFPSWEQISMSESVEGSLKVIRDFKCEEPSVFLRWNGTRYPW